MSKNFQRMIHETFLRRILLIHENLTFHRYFATWTFFAGIGHTLAHLLGTFPRIATVENAQDYFALTNRAPPLFPGNITEASQAQREAFAVDLPYNFLLFQSVPGITGILLLVCFFAIAMTVAEKVRRKNFELFWYTHHCYYAIYILLGIHGTARLVANPLFPFFIAGPGSIFALEKLIKVYRVLSYNNKAISIKFLPSGIIELIIPRPTYFAYRSGQYASVNVPQISRFQWHAFTISSSPVQHDVISFHISPAGDWTNALAEIGKLNLSRDKLPTVLIDGPFGTPSEQFYDFQHVMLISSGIGATPFASVLRELLHRAKTDTHGSGSVLQTVDFFWVNRKSSQLTWLITILQSLLKEQYELGANFLKINLFFTGGAQKTDFRSLFLWDAIEVLKRKGKLNQHCHNFSVTSGRPDWASIFKKKADLDDGAKEVGVFLCGNKAMATDVLTQCQKYSGKKQFRFKNEVF